MNSRRRASADSAAGGDRGGSDGPPRPPGVRRPTVPIPPSSSDPRLRGGGAPPPIRRARGSFSAQATKGDTKRAVKYARMGLLSQNSRRFYASECASSGDDEGDSLESSEEEEDDDEGGGLESITGEGEEDDGDEEGNASRRPLDFRRSTTTRVAMAAVAARASAAPARRKAEGGAKPGRETTLAKAAIRRPTTEDAVAPRPDDVGPDLLAEGQHYLSISMLVYMYAHLRETCRMGHTRVRLEEMDVNSYQGLYGKAAPEGGGEDVFRGSFSRRKKKKKGRNGGGPKRRGSDESLSTFGSSLGSLTVEPPKYLDKTKSAGQIIRIVIDELGTREGLSGEGGEEGRDESDDLGRDMMGGANSEYERRDCLQLHDCHFAKISSCSFDSGPCFPSMPLVNISVLKEFNTWISDSKVSQLDEDTQEAINKLRRQVARQRWKRAKSLITISRVLSKRSNIGELQPSSSAQSLLELDEDKLDANRAQMAHHLRRQVARYRWKRAISRVIIGIRLSRPAFPSWDSAHMNTDNIFVNMKKLMKEALDTQPKYFREGSVMNNLIESGIEVVWFSDLTQNDVVYGICCQRDQGRVAVVFRGTVNSHNWLINMKFSTTELSNPISDEYPGRSELLDVHTGFSLYMLRRRKDTHTNKIDEIFEMVDAIGREMCPDGNYKLSITGHSLGGALATLLGFYAAASEKFSNVKQIRVFTFAAPRVGASSFFHAYQHLERSGKIRHARFSCTRDLVPNIPPFNLDGFNPIKWRYYKHVGMRIQLHSVGDRAKLRLRQALDVTYPLHHDWLSELVRIFQNNLIVFLNTIKGYKKNHTLTEHQKRLHFASEYRLALSKSVLRNDKRRNHIKSLDEYYCIRANMAADGVSIEDDLNLWNTLRGRIERISKKLLTFVIVFALMCGWLVLVKSVADSLQREDGVNDITSFPHESGELFLSPDKHTQAHALADPDMVASLLADDDAQLQAAESQLKPIKEYATGITFAPKLDDLYLIGAGVRKKSIIKVYAVAMYSSPSVLNGATPATLGKEARSFTSATPMSSFILKMVHGVSAEKIAGAIAESVKPRYDGLESDIEVLESLIVDGVNKIGGQATKGTMFRFDCSEEGVSVSVNGALQGMASFEGMGSSFVDVFMDDNAVSPSLVGSCHGMWSGDEAKSMAASLLELSIAAGVVGNGEGVNDEEQAVEGVVRDERIALESQLNPLQEYSTGITFAPVLGDLLYLVGAGVRKKSIVKIYAVAMYSSPTVLSAVSSATLGNAARSFGPMNPMTSFVLDMVYSASAEKIAGAIAESVKPRYSGPTSDIDVLESLIVDGVNKIGGQATKGTVFRFDCSEEGVSVSVNGSYQGVAGAKGLGSAFVDVFVDNKAVSPSLVDNCLDTWSGEEARLLAVSMLELMRDELSEKQVKMAQVSSEEDTERSATDTLLADASDPKSEPSEGVGHTEQDANEMVLADTGDAKTDYEDVEQIDLDGPLASNAELKERSPASLEQGGREVATGKVALVSGEADVNHDLEEEQQAEQTQLPSPTLHNAPPPAPEDLRLNHSSDDDIHPLAKYRARDAILRQRESIMDAVQQSIQQDGGIQTRASDMAAERLRALASHITDDTALDSSASESAKKLFRLIFPIF
ncbi:hypothetical protein ACHAWF_011279 [Thalassiosira exigua]